MTIDDECDCDALERWKSWSHVLAVTCVVAVTATIVLGWSAASASYHNAVLRERLSITPADVLERLAVTPADVMARVESLEREMVIKPRDVLEEVKAMRAELSQIKKQLTEHEGD